MIQKLRGLSLISLFKIEKIGNKSLMIVYQSFRLLGVAACQNRIMILGLGKKLGFVMNSKTVNPPATPFTSQTGGRGKFKKCDRIE